MPCQLIAACGKSQKWSATRFARFDSTSTRLSECLLSLSTTLAYIFTARASVAMDPLVLALAEEGDCDALAALTHRALSPSLLHRRVFGGVAPEADEAFQAARLRAALVKPGMEVLKATRAGKLVGVSLHALPKTADSAPAAKAKKTFPEGTNLELAHDLFGASGTITEPHFCKLPPVRLAMSV